MFDLVNRTRSRVSFRIPHPFQVWHVYFDHHDGNTVFPENDSEIDILLVSELTVYAIGVVVTL